MSHSKYRQGSECNKLHVTCNITIHPSILLSIILSISRAFFASRQILKVLRLLIPLYGIDSGTQTMVYTMLRLKVTEDLYYLVTVTEKCQEAKLSLR